MINREQLEDSRNSTEYLERLETWYLLKWKCRLELLQETTEDLWLLREVLKDRHIKNLSKETIKFPKDNTPLNSIEVL